MELTTPLPCRHFRPSSITLHLDESTITGTRAMSGSAATRLRNLRMAASLSSMPSSMLTSMSWEPLSTCSRATCTASSNSPVPMSRLKRADPVTLVRSPTLTNRLSGPMVKGSSPDRRVRLGSSGRRRGPCLPTASTMARMCEAVVPQHPPARLIQPLAANSPSTSAMCSGVSSYSPNSLGSPALG